MKNIIRDLYTSIALILFTLASTVESIVKKQKGINPSVNHKIETICEIKNTK